MLLAWWAGFRRDEHIELTFDAATTGAAEAHDLTGYGIDVGCWADLVLVAADTVAHAVVEHPSRTLVRKHGTIVAGTDSDAPPFG